MSMNSKLSGSNGTLPANLKLKKQKILCMGRILLGNGGESYYFFAFYVFSP
ncbi:conserved hypothetical protein [Ricinus communis]|uniref:Uncharacterized protein n=1 Tax=Ricinus communis TaxID=3988 RepID=B9T0D2_RICCO|nr:conserved hypothetical protein [Ricinus communis]